MINRLLQFEFRYQIKQRAYILFSLLFLLLGIQLGNQGYSRGTTIFNSSYSISEITAIFTLGSVFIIMFFTISGVLRDKQFNMQSIIFSTSIKKWHYFLSRFLGVFVTSTVVFSSFLIGFAITTVLPNLDPEFVNPFNILHYLWALLIIVIPNIFICTTVIFSVSILTKNNAATYVAAILVYVLYFICSIFLNSPIMAQAVPSSPEHMAMAALFDPFGIAAMIEQTQFWTTFQKNTQSVAFSGYFMWNRILWMGIAMVLLLVTYISFSFRKGKERVKKDKKTSTKPVIKKQYQPVNVTIDKKSHKSAVFSLLRMEIKAIFKSLPFIGLAILWAAIVFVEIYSRINEGGQYNDSLYPITNMLLELFAAPLVALGNLLIVFFSGEIVWRERNLKFNEIIDSSPTANYAFYGSKLMTLLLLPVFLIIIGSIIALGFQIAGSYYEFEFLNYVSLLYYPGLKFMFYGILALFIQTIVSNKYLGMFVVGLIMVFFGTSYSSFIGAEHPLVLIGKLPNLTYTNMNGFGGMTKAYNHRAIYWLSLGGILLILTFMLWQRGIISSLSFRVKQAFSNWKRSTTLIIAGLFLVFLSSFATIYYNTNMVNDYYSSTDDLNYREAYERKFKQYETLGGLFPVKMATKVDLYPELLYYKVKADYVLRNKSNKVLDKVLITEKEPLQSIQLEDAVLMEHDSVFGTYLFQLKNSIKPQQELKYSYEFKKQLEGYETNQSLVANGTYIMHREFEPSLTYRSSLEITNSLEREQRGLPAREEEKVTDDHIQNEEVSFGRVHYETTISTSKGQKAIGIGELVREWSDENRNYYHYKSNDLIMPAIAYFSADYQLKKDAYNGIQIEQYYHKNHDFNNDRILESTKKTLDYCSANFGEYPFEHIRIAEVPGHWQFGGFAHPGTISMTEDRLYFVDLRDSDDFDLVAKRTIHEVAHQWFGHILAPKAIEGSSMFIEGFAKYIEAVVMEKMYGKKAVWQISRNANTRYFTWRAYETEQEPALYKGFGQGYLSYGKNFTVMLALKDLIGEEQLNNVVKTIIDKQKGALDLTTTSLDFLEELYKVTPQEQHHLIDDWFKRVITYDLSIENSSYKQLKNDTYEVTIKVNAKKYQQQNSGEATEVAINEPLSIGIFSAHPSEVEEKDILYLKPHQVNTSTMEMTIIVDQLPTHIAIDPFGTRSDANLTDNTYNL